MQSDIQSPSPKAMPMRLGDFGELQTRYQSLRLAMRATAVLHDAEPAIQAAETILKDLAANKHIKQTFVNLRKNPILSGKMRPSDARNLLLDSSSDYIEETRHKLAAWRKTIERLSNGEDVVMENGKEYIPGTAPLALAIAGNMGISSYLSIIQLALGELAKVDGKNASQYNLTTASMRRCSTVLSDCEVASAIDCASAN